MVLLSPVANLQATGNITVHISDTEGILSGRQSEESNVWAFPANE